MTIKYNSMTHLWEVRSTCVCLMLAQFKTFDEAYAYKRKGFLEVYGH
jgi:hypothetical protein